MADHSKYNQAFQQCLEKLQELYNQEISELCQKHEEVVAQLRSELDCQVMMLRSEVTPVAVTCADETDQLMMFRSEVPPDAAICADQSCMNVLSTAPNIASPHASNQGLGTERVQASNTPSDNAHQDCNISKVQNQQTESCTTTHSDPARHGGGTTILKQENKILSLHVDSHLDDLTSKSVNLIDKYALARGWEIPRPSGRMSHSRIQNLVEHQAFDSVCAIAIILNTGLMGAVTSFRARTLGSDKLPLHYDVANNVFSGWFLLELALRWIAEGLVVFLVSSRNVLWNLFDLIVVSLDIFEHVVELFTKNDATALGNLTIMRMLRVLRMARALRIVRLISICKELRMMVLSVLQSGMSLIWSMVLLSIIIYIFGIFLMQAVTEHLARRALELGQSGHVHSFATDSTEGKLERYFGNLANTFYTLFQTVSGGISWGEIGDPILETGWFNGVIFCFFIFFTIFAMLNIITGIFVETAITSVHNDSDEVIQEEMSSENSLIKQLQAIFEGVDKNKTGKITGEQFEDLAKDNRTHALLTGLGLEVSEAKGLFSLLDLDNRGFVAIDDFLVGFMRLRGGAKEVDLVSMMYENRRLMASWDKLTRYLMTEFGRMDKFEDRVDCCLNTLLQLSDRIKKQASANAAVLDSLSVSLDDPAVLRERCSGESNVRL